MFKSNSILRHQSCLDVDLLVVKVVYKNEEYTKMKVLYFNRRNNMLLFPDVETVKINTKDFDKWEEVTPLTDAEKRK